MKLVDDKITISFARHEVNEMVEAINGLEVQGYTVPSIFAIFLLAIGQTTGDTIKDSVLEHIKAGKKIQAIKELRSYTAFSLKEAKDICDQWGDELAKYGYAVTEVNLGV